METDVDYMEEFNNFYQQYGNLIPKSKCAIIGQDEDGETIFGCVECPLRFHELVKLEKHLCTHNRDYRLICEICGTGLKRKEHLDRHKLEHKEVRPHICSQCGRGFKRKEHLNVHMSIHSGSKDQVCTICNKSFYRKDHLQKHIQTHTKTLMDQNILLEPGNDVENLGIKQEIEFLDVTPMFSEEPDEEEDLYSSSQLEPLIALEESSTTMDNDRPYSCYICQKSYKRKQHLELHIWSHKEKRKICTECGKGFHFDEQLLAHMNIHLQKSTDADLEITDSSVLEDEDVRPHSCPVCHKTFKRKYHLKIHSWSHREKDKICPQCGKAFHHEIHLMVHLNTHLHQSMEVNEDSASSAPYLLPDDGDVDMFALTGNDLLVPRQEARQNNQESRPHECNICHRRFKRKQHLKVHGNVHSRQQAPSIWCSLCHQGFHTDSKFENHRCLADQEVVDNEDNNDEVQMPQEAKKENKYPEEYFTSASQSECEQVEQAHEQPQFVYDDSKIPVPQRVYVCKYCSKAFKRKDHYKIHLHIHTGIKTFFCPDCDKGFYRKDHLQKHAIVHSRKPKETPKPKRALPDLYPINAVPKVKEIKPEITIHAPSNTKLRVPLQIKVPYQMVMSMDNGEQRSVTVDPQETTVVS